MDPTSQVAAFGACYFEINSLGQEISSEVFSETEHIGKSYEIAVGGSAVYFSKVMKSLGQESLYIGKIGEDLLGDIVTHLLNLQGIYTSFIRSAQVQTNIAQNFITTRGESVYFVNGDANANLTPEEVKIELQKNIDHISYLYIGSAMKMKNFMNHFPEIAEIAHEHKIPVILDHGRANSQITPEERESVKLLAASVDYYFPSRDEFCDLWEADTIEQGIKKVREKGQAVVIVKNAENGVVGMEKDEIVHIPAFPVKPLNTVGAGDSFNAGFIRAKTLDLGFEESIRFANATAAIKISQPGLPSLDRVQQFLSEQRY